MSEAPPGDVAFLFTDIEGSTRLWDEQPAAMALALARHDALVRGAVEAHAGIVFKTIGDAFCAAFDQSACAIDAAVAAQRRLLAETWETTVPLTARMAVHTGTAERRDGDYFGPPLNRTARLLAAGHGGQILASAAVAEAVRDRLPGNLALRSLGDHRLRDIQGAERIYQVIAVDLPADFPPLRTPDALRRNLPTPPTPLIGRDDVVGLARAIFGLATDASDRSSGPPASTPPARLVTLTGPGGAGKTRLAIHLATDFADAFADGVAFVPLAAISEADLVASEVAAALEVRDRGDSSIRDRIVDHLRDRELLLVLDNFEQVTAAAPFVADLLAACSHLSVLATSRERLRLRAERELPVPPLDLPPDVSAPAGADPRDTRSWAYCATPMETLPTSSVPLEPAAALGAGAVQLFIERAREVRPSFALDTENAAIVAEICRRLDGLPLAIELAAARSRLLSPAALLARLESRLDLLAGGARDLPARHQTMRDTIAWSYDLLDAAERRAFAHLAAFAGGCTLDAAEAVIVSRGVEEDSSTPPVLDLVASLVDKSLLRVDETGAEPRLAMLETIRDVALERLGASGEAEVVGGRHAAVYVRLAEDAQGQLEGRGQAEALDRLARDQANLRLALRWLREHGDVGAGLRLAGALWRFWWLRGHVDEGRAHLAALLAHPATQAVPEAVRIQALNGAGVLAECQGDYDDAAALHEESLRLARSSGDMRGVAWSLNNLGVVAVDRGDFAQAQALLAENLAVAQTLGDQPAIATALTDLGNVAFHVGDRQDASERYRAALALFRALGDETQTARVLNNLSVVAMADGDLDRAESLGAEALSARRAIGDKPGVAQALNNLAEVSHLRGDTERAAVLSVECLALARALGDKLTTAVVLERLAGLDRLAGDDRRSFLRYREALLIYRALDDWVGIETCLVALGRLVLAQARPHDAVRLLAAAATLREAHDLTESDADAAAEATQTAATALGAESFEREWRLGMEAPLDDAIGMLRLVLP